MRKKNTQIEKETKVEEEIVQEINLTEEDLMALTGGGVASTNFTYGLAESLWMEDLDTRKIFLDDYVDNSIFRQVNYFVLRCNELDKMNNVPVNERNPVKLYINSGGGSICDGISTIEMIKNSITPVWGICMGYAMSMGFHIFANCHRRFSTNGSIFLNHEGEEFAIGHPSKNRDCLDFNDRIVKMLNGYIVSNTKLTHKELEDTKRIENYMFGSEAKELGIVTDIIGVDCTIDEIL